MPCSGPQCDLYACLALEAAKGAVDPFFSLDMAWVVCTSKCYLEKAANVPRGALFALSADDVADIKRRNPALGDEVFVLPSATGPRPCKSSPPGRCHRT